MFHKEGYQIIVISLLITSSLIISFEYSINKVEIKLLLKLLCFIFFVLILQFFRNPKRNVKLNDKSILAPADGKIVIIKEVFEKEFYKEKRLQVSIFMSPFNVHVTRYPVGGEIIFSKLRQKNDIVFLDPPFKDKNLYKILSNINNNKILKKDGIVIIHRHKKENDNYPEDFKILEEKIYGISKIIFGLF